MFSKANQNVKTLYSPHRTSSKKNAVVCVSSSPQPTAQNLKILNCLCANLSCNLVTII